MANDKLIIEGARQHNLKNINVSIPRDKLVVLTGISGSGKSSLAFDTIYAEGQRRYVESLSAYARQFLGQMDKPDVDHIEGLSPAISIDQKTTNKNPRSTVGTITEIYDYLRLLFARVGHPHCPVCGEPISSQSVDQMIDALLQYAEGTRLQILAPIVRGRKGEYVKLLADIKSQGFLRIRLDGEMRDLDEEISLDKQKKHTIEIVVDRLVIREGIESRLADSLEIALEHANGLVKVLVQEPAANSEPQDNALDEPQKDKKQETKEISFNQNFACAQCGISLEEITPRLFSFNSPYGACPTCGGLGYTMHIDEKLLMPHPEKSIKEGGIMQFNDGAQGWYYRFIVALAERYGFSLEVPVEDLPRWALDYIFYGSGTDKLTVSYENQSGDQRTITESWEGLANNYARRYKETASPWVRNELEKLMAINLCPDCHGARLKPISLGVTIADKNIHELSQLSIEDLRNFIDTLQLSERETLIAEQILKQINERLSFLVNVGLDYLALGRTAASLSGGEAQRIRLATQIGSQLTGVLYILDEPSIGLHQKDNAQLINTLLRLKDLGNTVLVVEHDENTILAADFIVDIGPGAGAKGGHLVVAGSVEDVKACKKSITGQYLNGSKKILLPPNRRIGNGEYLRVFGAAANNLQDIDVAIPLGTFTCVTGVSGSGKSSLVNHVIYTSLAHFLNGSQVKPGPCKKIEGLENLEKVIAIDQSPIGRTPRSNPATYTGVFNDIRELFAMTPDAKAKGYKSGRFSFNVRGGRCEACQGDGIIKIEMHFLADVYVPCEVCHGKRYNRETLEIRYKGKNIADVLDMTVDEAVEFFANIPKIYSKLLVLQDVGLGYVKLGQSATTLSGGEAQRVKLASELARRSHGKTFYILDEPTTGLHTADIHKLLHVFDRLVEAGNTLLVIEHNLDVIKSADYIIDLGPDGGRRGGRVICCGTPEEIAAQNVGYTSPFVQQVLQKYGQVPLFTQR